MLPYTLPGDAERAPGYGGKNMLLQALPKICSAGPSWGGSITGVGRSGDGQGTLCPPKGLKAEGPGSLA